MKNENGLMDDLFETVSYNREGDWQRTPETAVDQEEEPPGLPPKDLPDKAPDKAV